MIKRAFIRGLWGKPDTASNAYEVYEVKQRASVERDLKLVLDREEKFNFDYVAYTMGKENTALLKTIGIKKVEQIWDAPYIFGREYLWKHKIEIMRVAMQEYDEIIWLDWDCNLVKQLPSDFWENMAKRACVQACLFTLRRPYCIWRNVDWGMVANGGFIYFNKRELMDKFVEAWYATGKKYDDETALSYVIDELAGGWKGPEYYSQHFEPLTCRVMGRRGGKGTCTEEVFKQKDHCFYHYYR